MRNLLVAQSGGPTAAITATVAGVVSCAFVCSGFASIHMADKMPDSALKCNHGTLKKLG